MFVPSSNSIQNHLPRWTCHDHLKVRHDSARWPHGETKKQPTLRCFLKRPWLPWSLMILVWSWATQCFIISWWVKWFSYPYFYGKMGRIWAFSVGLTAQLLLTSSWYQSVADLHAAPFFANSMMVEFAGDQVLKFYNSHLLELTGTCSGEDGALRWRIFAIFFVTSESILHKNMT